MKAKKLFELVTGNEMKPWLSRNKLPNINTCENGWSNFSANLKVVSLKLLELTQFAWPNLSIYFNFLCSVPSDDVIESTRSLMRPPVIIPPWAGMHHRQYICLVSMMHLICVWCPWYIMNTPGFHYTQFLGLVFMIHNIYVWIHYTQCLVSPIINYVWYPWCTIFMSMQY